MVKHGGMKNSQILFGIRTTQEYTAIVKGKVRTFWLNQKEGIEMPQVKKKEYPVVLQGQPAVKPMVVSQPKQGEKFRVWSPNEFSRLKRVLIGRPEGTNMPAAEWAWRYNVPGCKLPSHKPFPEDMVAAANEQMDYFVAQLEKRGILVDRIPILPMMMLSRIYGTSNGKSMGRSNASKSKNWSIPSNSGLTNTSPKKRWMT